MAGAGSRHRLSMRVGSLSLSLKGKGSFGGSGNNGGRSKVGN